MKLYRNFLLPVGLLSGTIIGAGVFALPFVFRAAGLALGFFYLFLGAGVYSVIHLMYADIILRTKGEHRFVGYLKTYLGHSYSWLGVVMAVLQMLFVMTIYLVLAVSFINLVSSADNAIYKILVFWLAGSLAIFLSTKRLALVEFLISWGMIAIIIVLFAMGTARYGQIASVGFYPDFGLFLFPLAPVFFALAGRVAIPSLVKYFNIPGVGHNQKLIRRTIVVGTVLPAAVYALFVLGVLGLSNFVSEDAVTGLIGSVPGWVLAAVGVLGILSLWSSYIVVGLDVGDTLRYDLKLAPAAAVFLVVVLPLVLYFGGFQNFIELVSFVGGIFLTLESVLIILMWFGANRVSGPSLLTRHLSGFVVALTGVIFAVAFFHEIFKVFD